MAVGLATIGVKIGYKTSTSGNTYTDLPNLQTTPELGGTPEKIDVTTLADSFRRYVNGVKDYGDLDFVFLYDGDQATSSYKMLKTIENKDTAFRVTLPDSSTFDFTAAVIVKMGAAEVDGALTFTGSFALSSDVTWTEATGK